jgi:hypothetical protein
MRGLYQELLIITQRPLRETLLGKQKTGQVMPAEQENKKLLFSFCIEALINKTKTRNNLIGFLPVNFFTQATAIPLRHRLYNCFIFEHPVLFI